MKQHTTYKDSGIEWIGEIPEHWEVRKLGNLLSPVSIKNRPDLPLLSITREDGIILRDIEDETTNHNFIPDDLSNYKMIRKGQFGMNKMKAWQGSYGVSRYDGIVSPAYFIFRFSDKIDTSFFHIAIRSRLYVSFFGSASDGVRIGQWDLNKDRMKSIPFIFPPLSEQAAIAEFLDEKTGKIDEAIRIKEREIELLKERRQILIQEVVTGKKVWHPDKEAWLPPTKTKDSGIEWIGEIPEEWEVRRLKYVSEINKKTLPENTKPNFPIEYIDIGSVSFENGIEKTEKYTFKNSPSRARRIADHGNIILSTVRTYLKAIDFISSEKQNFIYSTGFAVIKPSNKLFPQYLYSYVRSNAFTNQVKVNSTGISYPAINGTKLKNQQVLYLSYINQQKIVSYLENIESKIFQLITLKEEEIEKLKEYKMVLIDAAVTGKMKVGKMKNACPPRAEKMCVRQWRKRNVTP